MANDGTIEHSLQIAASPAVVFSYFTDAQRLVRWKGISANLDPRPGGAFSGAVFGLGSAGLGYEVWSGAASSYNPARSSCRAFS